MRAVAYHYSKTRQNMKRGDPFTKWRHSRFTRPSTRQILKALPALVCSVRGLDELAAQIWRETTEARGRNQSPKLIYHVDDHEGILELCRLILEQAGFHVKTFQDRVLAWRAFLVANPRPALLITDYLGYPITAEELIRRCREAQPWLKVLMVTGMDDPEFVGNWRGRP